MGTGFFPRIKRPGRGVDHPQPSSAEVKERVELYQFSPYMLLWRERKQLYRFIPKVLCPNYYLFMLFRTRLNLYQAQIEQTRNNSWSAWTWRWKSKSIRSLRNYWLNDTVSHSRRLESSATPLWEPDLVQTDQFSQNVHPTKRFIKCRSRNLFSTCGQFNEIQMCVHYIA